MPIKRPPIVVIMGHVDHGKTTLLDYIRKTTIAAREAGGITQSIGAYEIVHNGQKITFIDTPGHEAFSKMRRSGAKVADIAILVVAADEGVKPQTKDALLHIREAKIPFIVAINKIDKPGADIDKTKNELGQAGVFVEGYGGDVSWHAVSAKTGKGVNELLDLILLASEVENLKEDDKKPASGFVLTSRVDSRRGVLVGVVLKEGRLEVGQIVSTESASGKIKRLENFLGQPVKNLEPSAPALIVGFNETPKIGENFTVGTVLAKKAALGKKAIPSAEKENAIKLALKADEDGSLEALENVISKLSSLAPLQIVSRSIGNVYENDVKLASSVNALIIGFKIKVDKGAQNMAQNQNLKIITSPIVYELERELEKYIKEEIPGVNRVLEVLAVFGKKEGQKQIIGGKIIAGKIKNQEKFEVSRDEKIIGAGRVLNLQSGKKDVAEAETGKEVGMLVESDTVITPGCKLVFKDQ